MHKHAKQMMEYAQDAMESETPWERWDGREEGMQEWFKLRNHPAWFSTTKYRRRPRTILVNGYEVPEPEKTKPDSGSRYFFPSLSSGDLYATERWDGGGFDAMMLDRSLVHLTKEAAQAHGRAMCGIDPLKTEAV